MLRVSGNRKIVVPAKFLRINKADREYAIGIVHKPCIKEGQPGNAVALEQRIQHVIPLGRDALQA